MVALLGRSVDIDRSRSFVVWSLIVVLFALGKAGFDASRSRILPLKLKIIFKINFKIFLKYLNKCPGSRQTRASLVHLKRRIHIHVHLHHLSLRRARTGAAEASRTLIPDWTVNRLALQLTTYIARMSRVSLNWRFGFSIVAVDGRGIVLVMVASPAAPIPLTSRSKKNIKYFLKLIR